MWKLQKRVKCKKCLHLNVCDGLYFNLDKECERTCGYYEDCSKYEEVTHCKNCMQSENKHCSNGQVWCNKLCVYMKEDGHCSLGVRGDQ